MAGDLVADRWFNGDGTENYKCRAWINFNGSGTVAARAAGNATVVDNGVGDYTVNFTAAMPDADYATVITRDGAGGATNYTAGRHVGAAQATSSVRVFTSVNGSFTDCGECHVAVFR